MRRVNGDRSSRSEARSELVEAVDAFGVDAVSSQALEPGLTQWRMREGVVSYAETSAAWVAVGGPLAAPSDVEGTARGFVRDARARGKRASFFGCDHVDAFGDAFARLPLGEQPLYRPSEWASVVAAHRGLRDQLRRARAKKVRVRRVEPADLERGAPMRAAVDELAQTWLASRPMEPMGFLVTLSLFEEPRRHRYWVAEREDRVVAFLSLVPIGRCGLLVEDLLRDRTTPNGTTEALFHAAMRDAAANGVEFVTWGLAPLSGPVPRSMRLLGALGRGLYDFRGLRAFKARLHPSSWQPVYLVYPRGEPWALHLLDSLRAFAGGSLVAFGLRTAAKRPRVLPWLLTLALIPWTVVLVVLLALRAAEPLFGFARAELMGWAVFDALFAALLVRAFWAPRAWKYLALALGACADAALASIHLAHAGFGASPLSALVRTASMLAPALAALGLARCAIHARSGH